MSHNWIGLYIKVIPCSSRGTNRLNEHGKIWRIKKVWGNKILVETDNGGLRWIDGDTDRDFGWEFVEVV